MLPIPIKQFSFSTLISQCCSLFCQAPVQFPVSANSAAISGAGSNPSKLCAVVMEI